MEDRLPLSLQKIRFFLLTLFCLRATILFGQPGIEWDDSYGGYMSDYFVTAQATPDGGYILAGLSSSPASGDKTEPRKGPPVFSGYADFWIVKIAANGTKQWDRTLGGKETEQVRAIIVTSDGGYLVGGTSKSNAESDKTDNDFATDKNKKGDYWIIKLNADGTKQWDKTFGGGLTDELRSMAQTSDGGYILAGDSPSSTSGNKSQRNKGGADYWIVKITSDGTKQWDKAFGGTQTERLASVKQTSDGGYILAGSSGSPAGADKTEPARGDFDYWLVKISAAGSKEWDKTYGGNRSDICTSLAITPDGGYVLGGTSQSGKSGEKSEGNISGRDDTGFGDYWVVKVLADGTKQWDKTVGGTSDEIMNSIVVTPDGGYILGGGSQSGRNGDKTEASKGYSDFWLVKLSPVGAKVWDKTIGTSEYDELRSISPAADGGYLLGGQTSYAGHDGDKLTSRFGSGDTDYWVLKWTAESGKKLTFSPNTLKFETTQGSPLAPPQSVTLSANEGTPNIRFSPGFSSRWLALPPPAVGPLQIGLFEPEISWGLELPTFVAAVAPGYERAILNVNLIARPATARLEINYIGNVPIDVDQALKYWVVAKADPGQTVTYSLVNAPAGAVIDPATGLFQWTPSLAGVYSFFVKAVTDGPPALAKEAPMTITVSERTDIEKIRINAAGSNFTTADGRNFIADAYFGGNDRTSTVPQGDIANTTDDDLYRTGRCTPSFNYTIPVRNGNFQVILHFAETWFGAPGRGPTGAGKRLFHVNIEGARKLTNYDIFAKAGGAMRAIQETFPVTVTDNELNINFLSGAADMPRIAAIEVIMVERLARVELPLIADAYVNDGTFANTNFGSDPTLIVKTGIGNNILRNAYLKFGLGDISDITRAKLRIYGGNVEYRKSDFVALSAFGLQNDSWTENGITWNNAPSQTSLPVGSTDIISNYDSDYYYDIDVTDFVRSEQAGDKIATFMLRDIKGTNQKLSFHSKEGDNHPQLVIYTNALYAPTARISQDVSAPSPEFETQKPAVYPNPTQKSFTLEIANKHNSNLSAEMVDVTGKSVRINLPGHVTPGSKTEIDLAPLAVRPGIYLINVRSTIFTETHKLLIVQ